VSGTALLVCAIQAVVPGIRPRHMLGLSWCGRCGLLGAAAVHLPLHSGHLPDNAGAVGRPSRTPCTVPMCNQLPAQACAAAAFVCMRLARLPPCAGTPISAYGTESHNRAARQRIPHRCGVLVQYAAETPLTLAPSSSSLFQGAEGALAGLGAQHPHLSVLLHRMRPGVCNADLGSPPPQAVLWAAR
jgi:hypothetical protein